MMKTFTVSTAEEVLNITADEGGHWDDLQPGTNKVVATVNTDTEPVNFVSSTDWMAAQVRNSLFGEYAGCPSCLHRTDEDRPRRAQLHVDIGPQTQAELEMLAAAFGTKTQAVVVAIHRLAQELNNEDGAGAGDGGWSKLPATIAFRKFNQG